MFFKVKEFDYADEFNYPVNLLINGSKEDLITLFKDTCDEFDISMNEPIELGFGTNEALDFSVNEIIELIHEAKELSEEEYNTLIKFDVIDVGLDVLGSMADYIYWTISDNFDEDKAEEFSIEYKRICE